MRLSLRWLPLASLLLACNHDIELARDNAGGADAGVQSSEVLFAGSGGAASGEPLAGGAGGAGDNEYPNGASGYDNSPGNYCVSGCDGFPCGTNCLGLALTGEVGKCVGGSEGFCDGHGICIPLEMGNQWNSAAVPPACVTDPCQGRSCGQACTLNNQEGQCRQDGVCDVHAAAACL